MRSVLLVAAAAAAKQPPLWPLPQNYSCSTQKLTVIPSPAFFRVDAGNDVLAAAAKRYIPLAFPHGWGAPGVGLPALSVVVDEGVGATERAARRPRRADDAGALYPALGDDESYKLRITATSATLKARTVWGALRGLETFSQLVTYEFDTATYQVVPCTIQDAPKYPHRGLMVDSGRHFLPVATLLHIVDALPFAKLNVLHWHLTDTRRSPSRRRRGHRYGAAFQAGRYSRGVKQ